MSQLRVLVSASFWGNFALLTVQFSSFLFWILVARFLPLPELDKAVLCYSLAWTLSLVLFPGINIAVLRLVPEDPTCASTVLFLVVVLCVISFPLVYFLAVLLGLGKLLTVLCMVLLLVISLERVGKATLLAFLDARPIFRICMVTSVIKLALAPPLLFTTRSAVAVVLLHVLYYTTSTVLYLLCARPLSRLANLRFRIGLRQARQICTISLSYLPGVVTQILYTTLPLLPKILRFVTGTVGAIYVTFMIVQTLLAFINTVTVLAIPYTVHYRTCEAYSVLPRYCTGLAILATSILATLHETIIWIVKPTYVKYSTLIIIFAWLALTTPLRSLADSYFTTINKFRLLAGLNTLTLITFTTLTLSITLLEKATVNTLAIAIVLSQVPATVIALAYFDKKTLRYMIIATICLTAITVISVTVHDILLRTVLTTGTTLAILHISKTLTLKDIATIIRYTLQEATKKL